MFKFLKSIFTAEERPLQLELPPNTEEFNAQFASAPTFEDVVPVATFRQMKNGKFRLLGGEQGNEVIATYARLRDLKRGAERRGLILLED